MNDPLAINEEPRALRYGEREAGSAMSVLIAQMRANNAALEALLAEVACEHFELEHAVREAEAARGGDTANAWKAVGIVADRITDLLANYRIAVEDPTGETWSDGMRADYELIGFAKREDVETPRVAHVHAPLVRRWDRVIRRGKVTVDAPAFIEGRPAAGEEREDSAQTDEKGD